ncbi:MULTISPECIES: hypothetical protein [unclassified Fusibacter]|uniref:hypothetical protein n=1 Tax=unclassified Fusibacter TaxID=2624464 RepID=UPI001012EC3F|nr:MULTISPECIES: hypothetical protein [unclassified Fusibacter]MCK8061715.1 hypothetical protein [Fusibacter sp. A2]NPE23905.1 hypothetical protein [Fusibacter sp. A1]RXV58065.1 hypothetical protein DWB64_19185 [Fusibacter sp. A1]
MEYKFIEDDFIPPFDVVEDHFILRKLTVDEVEKDFNALMSSKESLRQIFSIDDDWPKDTMTIEENYRDLKIHQDEFDNREGFAYTVVNKEDTECIGCVYIWPWIHGTYDSLVFYWVTDKVKLLGFEDQLGVYLNKWLKEFWRFEHPLMPGRNISLIQWEKMVEEIKKVKE